MKNPFNERRWKLALQVLLFVAAAGVTYYLVPHREKTDRNFEIGRPWEYELLTAPMDFPIYKLDEELKAERDSAMRDFAPYLVMDQSVGREMRTRVSRIAAKGRDERRAQEYLEGCLRKIYASGVIPLEAHKTMSEWKVKGVSVIGDDKIAREEPFANLFTIRSAYDYIMAGCENEGKIDAKALKKLSPEDYLKENVTVDTAKTEKAKAELMDQISPTQGVVQKGEKIIDRGEVVDRQTYKILRSLEILSEMEGKTETGGVSWHVVVGELLVIVVMYLLLASYFYLFRPKVFYSFRSLLFMLLMMVAVLAVASAVVRHTTLSIYIVPFAILPLVVRVFFDSRTALFLHLIMVLLASVMVSAPFDFMLLQIAAGMTAVSSLKDMNARSQLVRSAALIFLSYVAVFTGLEFMKGTSVEEFPWLVYVTFFLSAAMLLFAYGLIYICEKAFGFLSSVTLVELSNVNNSILMDFSEKAPGTFQHVLQVSNLAVEVAKKLDANALLVRTGALYHDIGKLFNPMLFTENQTGGINPLSEMPYEQAAQLVINHVVAGVKMAEKAGLPEQIIDFVRTHHGKTKTKYFYNSYKNKYPDKEVDESLFTYPGPLPQSVETAIVMMADVVEATSRSLPDHKEETIDRMVENLINGLIADGQFKDAPISFRDVETAKAVFKDKLKNIYHSRISYPELKKKEERKKLFTVTNKKEDEE